MPTRTYTSSEPMTPGGATIQSYAGQPVTWRSSRTSMTPLAIHAAFTTAGSEARRRSSWDLFRKRESQAKAAQAQVEAAQAQAEAARAQAEQAAAKAKVATEQDAAIARALQEDEAHRQADLEEVAVEEAEAVPDWPPDS